MAKTTLKPWQRESVLVDVESTEPLTKEEEEAVCKGIRTAFPWRFSGEMWPFLSEVKKAIRDSHPELVEKLLSIYYH